MLTLFIVFSAFVVNNFDALSEGSDFMFLPKEAKNFKQKFVFYVLPAPDYPLITIDWFLWF